METRKEKTVVLTVPRYGISREFQLRHAERLLGMGPRFNGGWELPEGSKYYYDSEHGLRLKANRRKAEKANKKTGDTEGGIVAEPPEVSL